MYCIYIEVFCGSNHTKDHLYSGSSKVLQLFPHPDISTSFISRLPRGNLSNNWIETNLNSIIIQDIHIQYFMVPYLPRIPFR